MLHASMHVLADLRTLLLLIHNGAYVHRYSKQQALLPVLMQTLEFIAASESGMTCIVRLQVMCVMLCVSCVMCHVSCVMCHVSCVMCHVSCVMCHVSCVMCHVSCVNCHHHSTSSNVGPALDRRLRRLPCV